jgi:hypothetical protein
MKKAQKPGGNARRRTPAGEEDAAIQGVLPDLKTALRRLARCAG